MRARLSFISLSAPIRSPVSSRVATLMSVVRSPAATWRAAFTACCNGRTIPRVTSQPSNMPMATPSTASVIISARMRSYRSVPACTDTAAAFSLLTARSVIRSSSFCDETTTRFYFPDGRIGLGQRLRLGRAEEVLGLALPGVLDLDELGQQTLAFVGLEGLAGAVAQLVHGLHGIVELLAQRLALLLAGRGQIPSARASGVDQVDVRFLDIRNAAQLGVIEPVIHFVDAGEPPDAEGADHAAYHRHN